MDMHLTPKFVNGTNLSAVERVFKGAMSIVYLLLDPVFMSDHTLYIFAKRTCSCHCWLATEIHQSGNGGSKDVCVEKSYALIHPSYG